MNNDVHKPGLTLQPIAKFRPRPLVHPSNSSETEVKINLVTNSSPTSKVEKKLAGNPLIPLTPVLGPILKSSSPVARTDQIWKTFRRDDLFLLENDPKTPYRRRKYENKTAVHWGQRKLALTTLAVINLYWDPIKYPNPIFVYAGAAPGTNLNFIIDLYPQIEWHLYDPHPGGFKIKPNPKIHLYKEYFTDQIASEWSKKNVFFISDIRTVDITKVKESEKVEAGIWNDMKRQEKWVKIIKPVVACLKFRLPYSGIKPPAQLDYFQGSAPYLAGIVLKQPWVGQTSTETRLLVPRSDQYPIHNWSIRDYENKMFHQNSIIRELVHYHHPFYLNHQTRRNQPVMSPELTNDWDSLTEVTILSDYLVKMNITNNLLEMVVGLSKLLTISIQPKYGDMNEKDQIHLTIDFIRHNPHYYKQKQLIN